MRKISILRAFGTNDCYECGGCEDLQTVCDFEEVSDEDYDVLVRSLSRQDYSDYPRYIMIEQTTVKQVKQDLRQIIEQMKYEEKQLKILELEKAEKERKRKENIELKRKEKEKKKFEELKKKFEESDKDQ